MTSLSGRMLGIVVSAALLLTLAACSPRSEEGAQNTGEGPQAGPARREAGASERATADEGESEGAPDARVLWKYVALGDSLAVGVGARRGYVERYAEHLQEDTGASIEVQNMGVSGQTSLQLLNLLRHDPSTRRALSEAEIVTFNIGINDLGQAGRAYEDGTCGGADNEECLRAAVEAVERNWDTVIEEILGLRSTDEAIIRTAGLGYTPNVDEPFEPYLGEVTRRIAESAADNGIHHVAVRLDEEAVSPDGVHPNDEGYRVIASRLGGLGYEPLGPR